MRYLFLGVFIFIVLILSSLFASPAMINDTAQIMKLTAVFINKNKLSFLVWHIFLYIAIFAGLYLYAKHLIEKYKYTKKAKEAKKGAIILCFSSVILVIAIDSIYYSKILL